MERRHSLHAKNSRAYRDRLRAAAAAGAEALPPDEAPLVEAPPVEAPPVEVPPVEASPAEETLKQQRRPLQVALFGKRRRTRQNPSTVKSTLRQSKSTLRQSKSTLRQSTLRQSTLRHCVELGGV